MKQYRLKAVVIEAVQWFKNGDHPEDGSVMIPMMGDGDDFLSEGKVVRRYRHPCISGDRECINCGKVMHDHGWIDTLEGGHKVCPGDWIIKGVKGEFYPCKPEIFAMTYEAVSGEPPKPDPETVRAVIIDPEKMHLATDAIRDLDLLLDQTQNPEYKVIKELSQTLGDCLIVETPEQYGEGWTQMLLTQELEHSQGLSGFLWEIAAFFKITDIDENTEDDEMIDKIREKLSCEAKTPDIKAVCLRFFYWWYNAKGTNTEEGFDTWAKTDEGKKLISELTSGSVPTPSDERPKGVRIAVGTKVPYTVMFDRYDFEVISYSEEWNKYQLQWPVGKGSFWVDANEIEK